MIYILIALLLLLAVAAGMIRVLLGPTIADRMLAAQLLGTCGLAILLMLAKGLEATVLIDIALIFSLLALLATMTFVRRTWYD
ncbi:MAG: monovalent cation/H+ antiporter complex subunit F [Thermodesulfobacteriota bacterium]